jgi:hypothetical protein
MTCSSSAGSRYASVILGLSPRPLPVSPDQRVKDHPEARDRCGLSLATVAQEAL